MSSGGREPPQRSVEEEPKKKKRGGNKARKQKILSDKFEAGEHVPRKYWQQYQGFERIEGEDIDTARLQETLEGAHARFRGTLGEGVSVDPAAGSSRNTVPKVAAKAVPASSPTAVVPEPKAPPKNIGAVVPKGVGVVRLSDPVTWGNPLVTSTARPPRPGEIRISLDFHGVLDQEDCHTRASEKIPQANKEAILTFLRASDSHRVGICSYIGQFGEHSQKRRDSLRREFEGLNQYLSASGIPAERLVVLEITTDRSKSCISSESVSAHLDDRDNVIQQVKDRRVVGIQVTRYNSDHWPTARSLAEGLEQVSRLVFPRVFARPFYR